MISGNADLPFPEPTLGTGIKAMSSAALVLMKK